MPRRSSSPRSPNRLMDIKINDEDVKITLRQASPNKSPIANSDQRKFTPPQQQTSSQQLTSPTKMLEQQQQPQAPTITVTTSDTTVSSSLNNESQQRDQTDISKESPTNISSSTNNNNNKGIDSLLVSSTTTKPSQTVTEAASMPTPNETNENPLLNEKLINILLKNFSANVRHMIDLKSHMTPTWSGSMALKKLTFATNFYLLAGSSKLSEQILPTKSSANVEAASLQISQRLRLDSTKLIDIKKRLCDAAAMASNSNNVDGVPFSIFVLLPAETSTKVDSSQSQQRSLQSLIYYLDQKSAAGVIPMPDEVKPLGNVYIFTPSSSFAAGILKQTLPNLKRAAAAPVETDETSQQLNQALDYNDFLLVVILKFGPANHTVAQ